MNLEHICYGCFQEKPDDSPVCPHCGFNAEEEQPFLALPMGALLNGRYMTGKVLGVGGFGITYLGYDLTLEIKVAVKEYMPSGLATRHSDKYSVALTGRGQEDYQNGMERFLEEARILAKLQNGRAIKLRILGTHPCNGMRREHNIFATGLGSLLPKRPVLEIRQTGKQFIEMGQMIGRIGIGRFRNKLDVMVLRIPHGMATGNQLRLMKAVPQDLPGLCRVVENTIATAPARIRHE